MIRGRMVTDLNKHKARTINEIVLCIRVEIFARRINTRQNFRKEN